MLRFFTTFAGQCTILMILLAVGGFSLYSRYRQNQVETVPESALQRTTKKEQTPDIPVVPNIVRQTGNKVTELIVPTKSKRDEEEDAKPSIPEEVRKQMISAPETLTLFNNQPKPKAKSKIGNVYAPYGRQIHCRLINAVDSANIQTPLIGVVTQDVWNRDQNGIAHKVIAAGDEVHGFAQKGRSRDRIDASGKFVIVRRNDQDDNGVELTVNGIALDKDFDESTGLFGDHDASAGIRGELIETNELAEVKLFISTFLSAGTSVLKDQTSTLNMLTNQLVKTPKDDLKTAAATGAEAVLNEWAQRIRASIDKDGYYVAIRPGKQFYVYVTETINFEKAERGAHAIEAPGSESTELPTAAEPTVSSVNVKHPFPKTNETTK